MNRTPRMACAHRQPGCAPIRTNSLTPAITRMTPSSAPTAPIDVTSNRSTISEISNQAIPVIRKSHPGSIEAPRSRMLILPPYGHPRSTDRARSPGRSVAELPGAASWSRSDEIGRLGGAGRLGRRTAASARVGDHDAPVHVRVHVALEVKLARWQRGNGVLHGRGSGDQLPVEQLVRERAVRVDRDVVLHARIAVLER